MPSTYTDIDVIKGAEAALREFNATLQARVTERTAELMAAIEELDSFFTPSRTTCGRRFEQ